jgi:hypothetical protein
MTVVYISRLMKGHEVLKTCSEFFDQEARARRVSFKVVDMKKATLVRA